MAKRLNEDEVAEFLGVPALGAYVKYPWSDWTDGQWWRIERGVDFRPEVDHMRRTLKTHASRHSMQVRVHRRGDILAFKFTDNG